MPRRVFITVAEPSADQHAAHLARALRQLEPDIIVEALGGRHLREAGAFVAEDTTLNAAMMWRAALRAKEVARLLQQTREYFENQRVDLQICCDSWSMNWHFAKLAKEMNIPVLYYIAPQTWASRQGRIKQLKQYADKLACILPFEEAYFRQRGVEATFVGHPLFDELPAQRKPEAFRFPQRPPVIGLLPGSRESVAKENLPHQLEVAGRIREKFPEATFVIPTTAATHATATALAGAMTGVTIQQDVFDEVVRGCDLCLTVSGTATLHVAAWGVPMVVVYRANPLLWHFIGRWVVKTRTYSLVNILSEGTEQVVPEFIPWSGSNGPVAQRMLDFLEHPEKLEDQRRKLGEIIASLERPGASTNVAKMALGMMRRM